jgi:pyruvate formate lyase activating enzyme
MKGVVFEYQRWSIHDGPGARTTIFLKGCPLRCQWCCNPESQEKNPQIAFFEDKCLGCGRCAQVCPNQLPDQPPGTGPWTGGVCSACGKCVQACPSGARQMTGREVSTDEVLEVVRRDQVFYRRSGGGVTLSGGEPLAQPEFALALLERCLSMGIDTAIETCGHFDWQAGKEALKAANLVYLDLKHMDPEVHKQLTGVSNRVILSNAERMAREQIPLIIRIPVVPNLNDNPTDIEATVSFVRSTLRNAAGIELMPYHALGKMKYSSLGRNYSLGHLAAPSPEKMEILQKVVDRPRLVR